MKKLVKEVVKKILVIKKGEEFDCQIINHKNRLKSDKFI